MGKEGSKRKQIPSESELWVVRTVRDLRHDLSQCLKFTNEQTNAQEV